ncbi:hypothetical protein DFQ27_007642 [Actinomortierella ambigua]|uniref:DUF155 domain-containing protein n=1 Tax=Actinomortierella ambigua TaxID=1343610 RepID=A0A9P6TZE7_9FUNG|nr:hypothetical protein DFQ27_007642 [Actinomortierella ambigua]
MADTGKRAVNARSPLFQRRQGLQQQQHQTPPAHHHIQFITQQSPMPNPRQLFPDTSRAKRAFHLANNPNARGTTSPYGAINTSPMRINTGGYSMTMASPGGLGTPKPKQVPLRTTKLSQKLVLFPEDQEEEDEGGEPFDLHEHIDDGFQEDYRSRRRGLHGRAPTASEMMTKEQRNARGLSRVVAYCTAEGFDYKRLIPYLKQNHNVYPRLYDEALYAAYHFPLVPGKSTKFQSGPPIRSPGGGSILDKQLERYEENTNDGVYSHSVEETEEEQQRGRRFRRSASGRDLTDMDYQQRMLDHQTRRARSGSAASSVRSRNGGADGAIRKLKQRRRPSRQNQRGGVDAADNHDGLGDTRPDPSQGDYFQTHMDETAPSATTTATANTSTTTTQENGEAHGASTEDGISDAAAAAATATVPAASAPPFMGGEIFFFDYGVVVFWNFTVEQEEWILGDLAQFEAKRLPVDDVQTEEFHFEYVGYSTTPRIYNDMITLRGGNHMIKLTISHAISQSVKLALYECQMDDTIDDTKIIPIQLAETGKLNYSRPQITKISGHLFQLRMNVDLVSNVLDTPEIFWSEPELQPLYSAIRGYLEIGQRAKVLSDRCLVISDLLTMLRDDLASNNMNYITWIIIILIVIAVIVAAGEIVVKYLSHFGPEEHLF